MLKMKKLLLILSLCSNCFGWQPVSAQETDATWEAGEAVEATPENTPRPVTSVLTLGIGQGKMRDTYLTNLLYEGSATDITYERWRLMRQCRWNNQQVVDLSYMKGKDKSKLTTSMAGRVRYQYAMHKVWRVGKPSSLTAEAPFSLYVGPYAALNVGFNYNLKMAGSNNPATIHLTENFGASAGAVWHYSLRRQPCALNVQVQAPLLGVAMVPEYGASYYETFYVEDEPETSHVTSLHNQQDLDVRITTDIPLATIPFLKKLDTTVRLGFSYHIETMDINHIVTRYSTCQFVVGWTYQYLPYSRRKSHLLKSQPAYAY